MQGKVKTWKFTWGFITNNETGKDVFVHQKDLNDGLQELRIGQDVSYEIEKDERVGKEKAVNVSLIQNENN